MIEVTDLVKTYGKIEAVKGISFFVKRGEIFAFLGPNGAGKTTTIKMLTTLLKPTAGQILINSFDPQTDQDRARASFGIVFQDPSLDEELTAWENMEFHGVLYRVLKVERRERIEQLLKLVELWDKKDWLVKKFSGGMRRRLEIARGLLHRPKIFFLDEPSLGLDPQTRIHLWQYIKDLNRKEKVTIFFTTHYMEEAERMANYIHVIDHGKIVGSGTPAELQKQTKTKTLEAAFLKLTGHTIREEEAGGIDWMRMNGRLWRGQGGRR